MLVERLSPSTLGEPEKGLGYARMMTPHRRPYPTKNGYISVIAHSNGHWGKLFEAPGVPELIDDPRFDSVPARSKNIDAVCATLTEGMNLQTTEEWLAELRPADIPCGNANNIADLFTDSFWLRPVISMSMNIPLKAMWSFRRSRRCSRSPPNVHRMWPKWVSTHGKS